MKPISLISGCIPALFLLFTADQSVAQSLINGKINVPALAVRNLSLAVEKPLGKKTSVSLGLRVMPKGPVPLRGLISSYYDATDSLADDFFDNATVSSWGITPEFRYYFGKGPQTGLYLAPYVRFGAMSLDYRYIFTQDNGAQRPITFSGRAGTFTGGLMIGAQWNLSKRLLLDWWIVGASVGNANVELSAETDLSDLSASERAEIEESIESIEVRGNSLEATVAPTGARAEGKLPVPGLRTGICLGLRL